MEKEENLESAVFRALHPKKNWKITVFFIIFLVSMAIFIIFLIYPYISGFVVEDNKNKTSGNATINQSVPEANKTETNISETNETAGIQSAENDETGAGGTGNGGGGNGGPSGPGPSCTPNKDCSYYYNLEQCGSNLNDGCSGSLNCLACHEGAYCYTGEGINNVCINNSQTCSDSDNMNYYVKGNVTTDSLFVEDNCDGNLTEFYCYYNGSGFEIKNESYSCSDGCSNGACSLPQCTSNNNCTFLNNICGYGICNLTTQTCQQLFNLSTNICRADSGICGAAEYCTGSSVTCPEDINLTGSICRAAIGECDIVESCTGSSENCPINVFKPYGTPCSLGICDDYGFCRECINNSYCNSSEGEFCQNWQCIKSGSCITLSTENQIYFLNENINNNSLTDDCIKIVAQNIILDCQGYSILSTSSVAGVYSNQSYTTIKNCNISMGGSSGGYGIELDKANNSYIFNNTLNSQYTGIFLTDSSNSLIEKNTINFNLNKGIHLLMSYNNILENNEINNGSFYGIVSAKSANNIIQNNNIIGNVWYGILIETSLSGEPDGANQILDNLISSSRENIYVKTSGNIIKGNTLRYSQLYNGLYIYNASNNTIENNILNNNKISGLGLNEANNNIIKNNTVNYNEGYGIEVYLSNSNTIENNTASSNLINGLYIEASSGNAIKNNIFCNNTGDVYCDSSQTFENNNCNSGSVCGGSCEICTIEGLGEVGITGTVTGIKKGLKDYFIIIFIVVLIVLAILVNLRKYKKK